MKSMSKFFSFLSSLVTATFILLALLSLVILGLKFKGCEAYVVKSGSMAPAYQVGCLVVVDKNYPFEKITPGNVVVFSTGGDLVTHRVLHVRSDGLETKGDANEVSDGVTTTKKNYMGKVVFSNNSLGFVYENIFADNNKLSCIIILLSLFVLSCLFSAISNVIKKADTVETLDGVETEQEDTEQSK